MGRLALLAVAAALLLGGTACGERSEPITTEVSPYPVTVQGAGDDQTIVRHRPSRIAALDPAVATMLIELNAQQQLVGLPRPGSPSIWGLTGAALARALVRLHPDLIVASGATDPLDLARAAKATGAPSYLIHEDSLAEIDETLTQLGLVTDHAVTARGFVTKNRHAAREVTTAVAPTPVLRVFVDTGGFTTVSSRTLVSDLIRIGHGRNIAGRNPEAGVFDLRVLAKLDPQVLLTTDRTLRLADLKKDKRTRKLSAVKNGRLAYIPARYLRPDGDLGSRLAGLARILHPNALR
jgi:ABC-type Fe3+-hydroxamate transport system substrate-binding protein